MKLVPTYVSGLIFGLGIMISGMSNPAKVVNFFDVFGTWDPSLAFVMGGALVVTAIGYRLVFRSAGPVYENKFYVPNNKTLDSKLIGGSLIFGVGWGISGFCPGGAIPALGTGDLSVITFVGSMIAGMLGAKTLIRLQGRMKAA